LLFLLLLLLLLETAMSLAALPLARSLAQTYVARVGGGCSVPPSHSSS
jgi:hypothetical protein